MLIVYFAKLMTLERLEKITRFCPDLSPHLRDLIIFVNMVNFSTIDDIFTLEI